MATDAVERQDIHAFKISQEIEIAAPIDIAFQSVLDELGPEGLGPSGQSLSMKLEAWPGGRWFRDLGNNAGHLWGHVQVIKPPTLLEITGPMPMSYAVANHIQYRLKEEGGVTRLSFIHTAMGLIPAEHSEGMPKGWADWLKNIRENAERKASK